MPTTTKRFYIVKADDHAVVKSVPVTVCATPDRVDFAGPAVGSPCPVQPDTALHPVEPPESSQQLGAKRVAGALKHAVRRPALLHRPHLPNTGGQGR